MRSLRTSLVLGTTAGTAVVLLVAGLLLYELVRAGLVGQMDHSLVDKVRLLASTIEQKGQRFDLEFNDLDMYEFILPVRGGYLELWRADGRVLFRSPSLGESDLELPAGPMASPLACWVEVPGGRKARAAVFTFKARLDKDDRQGTNEHDGDHEEQDQEKEEEAGLPGSDPFTRPAAAGETLTLVLARDAGPIQAVLTPLKVLLVCVGMLTIAVSSGLLWVIVRRSLRPLGKVAAQISRLGEEDLSERVRTEGIPMELQPIVGRFNDLIGRLDAAFRRERAFTAEVAHELRTPLAGLRSTMEIALSRPRQAEQYRLDIAECLEVTGQVQAMVENLLSLARLDARQVTVSHERVLPNELVRTHWRPLARLAEARRLDVRWALGPEVAAHTDPSLLALVIRNILTNAVAHADEGGAVTIETSAEDDRVGFQVGNSGSTLSQEQAEQAFQRFWRADAARSAAGSHCGLGLSLVKKATAVLAGQVQVRSTVGGEFRIAISIPRRASEGGAGGE